MPPKKAASKKEAAVAEAAASDSPGAPTSSPSKHVTADTQSPSPAKSPSKAKKPAAKKATKETQPKAPKVTKEATAKPKAAPKKKAATKKSDQEPASSSGAESSSPKKKTPKKAASGGEEASPKKKPAAKKRTKAESEENGTATAEGSSASPAKKAKAAAKPKAEKATKAAAAKKTKASAKESGAESAAEGGGAGTPKKKKTAVKKKADDTDGGAAAPAPKKSKKKAKEDGEEATPPAKEKKVAKPRAKKPKPVEDETPVVGQRKNFTPLPTAMPKLLKKTVRSRTTKAQTSEDDDDADEGSSAEVVDEGEEEEAAPPKRSTKAAKKETTSGAKKLLNATDTDWENQVFQINSSFKLKIASWNVSGLRAWLEKGGRNYIMHERPDIVCLQETKCKPEAIPQEATISGYHPYWLGFGGQAGVGIYSRQMPLNVSYGIGDKEMDEEGRLLTAEYEKFFLVNVYVPNSGRKLVTLPKRLRWNKLFKEYISELDKKKAVIVCGDLNVAHEEIDLANPKTNKKNAGFTQEERDGMTDFLSSCGFVDTYRHFCPQEKGAYTFWTYMSNARAKNVGWRLDYILVSERILDKVVDNKIRSRVFGSDHCPIVGFFNL